MFEDIPFDFRHVKRKPKSPRMPKEWLVTARAKEMQRLGLPTDAAKATKSTKAVVPSSTS